MTASEILARLSPAQVALLQDLSPTEGGHEYRSVSSRLQSAAALRRKGLLEKATESRSWGGRRGLVRLTPLGAEVLALVLAKDTGAA